MDNHAYAFERNSDGYAVFKLTIEKGKVVKTEKFAEYDFLVIAVNKLSTYLMATLPDTLKSITRKDVALSTSVDEEPKLTETKHKI